jgi:hypothetical protein
MEVNFEEGIRIFLNLIEIDRYNIKEEYMRIYEEILNCPNIEIRSINVIESLVKMYLMIWKDSTSNSNIY